MGDEMKRLVIQLLVFGHSEFEYFACELHVSKIFLVMSRGPLPAVGTLIFGAVGLHMSNLVAFKGGILDGSRR
jgi:hypothetical protein